MRGRTGEGAEPAGRRALSVDGGRLPDRWIGRVRGAGAGPTLLGIGGLHGNEPAGVRALERLVGELRGREGELRGELVALRGNRRALAAGRRFLDRDLNRAWTSRRIADLRSRGAGSAGEDREQLELLDAVEAVVADARGPVYVVDLHTTSGPGGAFTAFGDTLANRELASRLPVPMILGLEELVEGTLMGWLEEMGLVGVVFESGQHGEPEAVERALAGLWALVGATGLIPAHRLPEASAGWKRLNREGRRLPRALEMRYRHPVEAADGFRMNPGYQNFQPVAPGDAVAVDARGPVRVPERARVLMPLYQEQGEDGFFLVREFTPAWLWISSALRRMRVDRVAHWLPGVRRDPGLPDGVVVDRRVARWFAVQLFHLLGFRRREDDGRRLVLRRRSQGPPPPGGPQPTGEE